MYSSFSSTGLEFSDNPPLPESGYDREPDFQFTSNYYPEGPLDESETAEAVESPEAASPYLLTSWRRERCIVEGLATHVNVWLPDSPNIHPAQNATIAEALIGDESRLISAQVLRMAAHFTATADARGTLRHDCAVFAMACETGNTFDNVRFNQPDGLIPNGIIDPFGDTDLQHIDAGLLPGQIVAMSDSPDLAQFATSVHHFAVKASIDEGPGLYFSKLCAAGPVALHTLEEITEAFPAAMIGLAHHFSTRAY
jgi:hypothetical protein